MTNIIRLSKIIIPFLLVLTAFLFMNARVDSNLNFSGGGLGAFDAFEPDAINSGTCGGGSCHGQTLIQIGNGSILFTVPSEVEAGQSFDVYLKLSGFTEAASNDITIGIDKDAVDNFDFTSTGTSKRTAIDGSGDSINESLSLTAPAIVGAYDLQAKAVDFSGTNEQFSYLLANASVTVLAPTESDAPVFDFIKANGNTLTNSTGTLSGYVYIDVNATDASAFTVTMLVGENLYNLTLNATSNTYTYRLNTYEITNGQKTINITATDSLGYYNSTIFIVTIENTGIQGDVTSYKVTNFNLDLSNQKKDDFWDSIGAFNVDAYSESHTGYIQSVHDDFYLYVLIAYDSALNWISIEFDADTDVCMELDHDGWAFGQGGEDRSYSGDIHFAGDATHPESDVRNDLTIEISESEIGLTYIEIKRPLNTLDVDGKDLAFVEGTLYKVKFASSNPSFHKQMQAGTYDFAISQATSTGGNTDTTNTEPTTSLSPEEFKNLNITNLIIWTSIGVLFNLALIVAIYIRRK